MCEAAGMVPQLARAVEDYGVPVISSGGFDSVTEKHALARDLSDHVEPDEVLHIGDHDSSGVHLFLALAEDVEAFGEHYGPSLKLDTVPVKDARFAFSGETCQAEAIAPDVLVQIVQDSISERLDQDAYDDVLECELAIRADLAPSWLELELFATSRKLEGEPVGSLFSVRDQFAFLVAVFPPKMAASTNLVNFLAKHAA